MASNLPNTNMFIFASSHDEEENPASNPQPNPNLQNSVPIPNPSNFFPFLSNVVLPEPVIENPVEANPEFPVGFRSWVVPVQRVETTRVNVEHGRAQVPQHHMGGISFDYYEAWLNTSQEQRRRIRNLQLVARSNWQRRRPYDHQHNMETLREEHEFLIRMLRNQRAMLRRIQELELEIQFLRMNARQSGCR